MSLYANASHREQPDEQSKPADGTDEKLAAARLTSQALMKQMMNNIDSLTAQRRELDHCLTMVATHVNMLGGRRRHNMLSLAWRFTQNITGQSFAVPIGPVWQRSLRAYSGHYHIAPMASMTWEAAKECFQRRHYHALKRADRVLRGLRAQRDNLNTALNMTLRHASLARRYTYHKPDPTLTIGRRILDDQNSPPSARNPQALSKYRVQRYLGRMERSQQYVVDLAGQLKRDLEYLYHRRQQIEGRLDRLVQETNARFGTSTHTAMLLLWRKRYDSRASLFTAVAGASMTLRAAQAGKKPRFIEVPKITRKLMQSIGLSRDYTHMKQTEAAVKALNQEYNAINQRLNLARKTLHNACRQLSPINLPEEFRDD